MQAGQSRNPVMQLVFTYLTCGFYALYWFYVAVEDVNRGLGEQRFNFVKEIALSIVTCGVWGFWFQWRFSEATVEVQNKWGVKPEMDAPILFIIALFGLGPFFFQSALNKAWEQGSPGGSGHGTAAPF
ncbi:MAG: DUF4234 domain-containing protein [Bradymonadaceae bacterium]